MASCARVRDGHTRLVRRTATTRASGSIREARPREAEVSERARPEASPRARPLRALAVEARAQRPPRALGHEPREVGPGERPLAEEPVEHRLAEREHRPGRPEHAGVTGAAEPRERPRVLVVHAPRHEPAAPRDLLGRRRRRLERDPRPRELARRPERPAEPEPRHDEPRDGLSRVARRRVPREREPREGVAEVAVDGGEASGRVVAGAVLAPRVRDRAERVRRVDRAADDQGGEDRDVRDEPRAVGEEQLERRAPALGLREFRQQLGERRLEVERRRHARGERERDRRHRLGQAREIERAVRVAADLRAPAGAALDGARRGDERGHATRDEVFREGVGREGTGPSRGLSACLPSPTKEPTLLTLLPPDR